MTNRQDVTMCSSLMYEQSHRVHYVLLVCEQPHRGVHYVLLVCE
jgi:hypothetical protein